MSFFGSEACRPLSFSFDGPGDMGRCLSERGGRPSTKTGKLFNEKAFSDEGWQRAVKRNGRPCGAVQDALTNYSLALRFIGSAAGLRLAASGD